MSSDPSPTSNPSERFDSDGWPTVSVIIPTHGRPDLLHKTVASVAAQDYPGPIQTIVVHDAEEPDLSLESEHPERTVTVITNSRARGQAGARNSGLALAQGSFVASCDDDDQWHTSKIRRQVEVLQSNRDAMAVGAGHYWVSPDGRRSVARPPWRILSQRQFMRSWCGAAGIHSSTLTVRREVFDRIGGYDESLPRARCEDLEFFIRVTSIGAVPVIQEPLAMIRLDYYTAFNYERRRDVAEALQLVMNRRPEYRADPIARARAYELIAMNYSIAGMHPEARRFARFALRLDMRYPRAWAIFGCSLVGIRIETVFRVVRWTRKALNRGPANAKMQGRL